MTPAGESRRIIRFGVFEADLVAGELRKNGRKLKLQDHPFRVLALLLERPGELISRDELREKLWVDTFVEFDHSLNTAINKIRGALGDPADNPRFIETLPRRGYRFIFPVAGGPVAAAPAVSVGSIQTAPPTPPADAVRARRGLWCAGTAAVLAVLAAAAIYGPRFLGPPSPNRDAALRPVPLTSFPGEEHGPSFSPDGTQVAFCWDGEKGDYDIYVQVIGTANPLPITDDPADEMTPAWSPDGRQVAFIRVSSDRQAVYVMPPLGGPQRKVAEFSDVDTFDLAWWPDSKSLLIAARESPEETLGLYRLFLDSGQTQRLTSPGSAAEEDRFQAVSPDGKTLAFARGTTARSQLYVASLGGGGRQQLTSYSGTELIYGLAWAADGRSLVYSVLNESNIGSFWRISARGGEPQPLPTLSLGRACGRPSISRQGGKLAFEISPMLDSNVWLYELPSSGNPSEPQKLTDATRIDATPRVSPDGTRIAFCSGRTGRGQIWVCDRDGSNLFQLTDFDPGPAAVPQWSPDGRQIAFDAPAGGAADIFVIRSDGGGVLRRMTNYAGEDSRPSWSHDGKWIYFNSDRGGTFQIWKAPAQGGEAVAVTKGLGYQALESPDGRYLYFAKGTSGSSLWRVPLAGGQAGQEEMVLHDLPRAGFRGDWDVSDAGIYFVERRERSRPAFSAFSTVLSRNPWILKLLRFDTGQVEEVMDLAVPSCCSALDISPDGKWFAYAQNDQIGSDLMLVEDFQ
jgi:Tol biopolymer transport system component/DNA-binding winged helix-turn-helix (wHTH) protein